jgi:hypothetical protein
MKALTLWQPWASLIAIGAKRIETRSWFTPYRGPLAIHAAKTFWGEDRRRCFLPPFSTILAAHDLTPDTLPLGKIVCLASLDECIETQAVEVRAIGQNERAFGDFSWGRFAWFLARIRPLIRPIPARGARRLWDWDWKMEAR